MPKGKYPNGLYAGPDTLWIKGLAIEPFGEYAWLNFPQESRGGDKAQATGDK